MPPSLRPGRGTQVAAAATTVGGWIEIDVAQPGGNGAEPEHIDNRTRGTYNLLRAAAAQGVRQIVTLSSLCLMTGHDQTFEVDEDWRPPPIVEAGGLSDHLCEFICREFAHEGQLNIIVLRVGNVIQGESLNGTMPDPLQVDPRDVAQAVRRSLALLFTRREADGGYWSVLHIRSKSPRSRFSIRKAARTLGYQPRF